MRSSTAGEDTVLATAAGYVTYYRVKIADALGAMQDMGTLGGYDWLDSVVLDEDIDAPCAALTVTLKREQDTGSGLLSLSPLRTDSALNASGPAVGVGRTIWFEFATKALGSSRPADGSTDWKRKFVGTTDKVSFPEGPFMTVTARDQGCDLVDLWLPPAPNMVDGTGALGERCSLEALMSAILQEGLGDPTATITAPTPSNYVVTSFPRSNAESVMDCLLRAAAFVGGDVRYAWNDTDGEYQVTLIVPDRTSPSSVFTIAPSQVEERREVALDRLAVRNHIFVSYRSNVTASRQEVGASDSTSITLYGERVLKAWEDDDSPIDTADEAQDFAGLILSDLKDPKVSQELSCFPDWRLELHDYGTFSANKFFDTDTDLALVGLRYEMTPNKQRMTLKTRGTPSAAYRRWLLRAYNHGQGSVGPADNGLSNINHFDAADGSTRTWTWDRGINVAYVGLFEREVNTPFNEIDYVLPGDIAAGAAAGLEGYSILPTTQDSYTAIRPEFGHARQAIIVPYYKVGGGYAQGTWVKLLLIPDVDSIPQGTVSINEDGSVTLSVDGHGWVESYKYKTSTSAFPTDSDVLSTGTILNGRQGSVSLPASTLDLGDTIYATFMPYSVPDAAGVPGTSFRIRDTRHDASNTTTTYSTFAVVTEAAPRTYIAGSWELSGGGYITNYNWPTGAYSTGVFASRMAAILTIPDGVTITGVSADLYVDNTGTPASGSVSMSLERVASTGALTTIATAITDTTGWQTKTASCSESTTGRNYRVLLSLDGSDPILGVSHRPVDGDLRASVFSYTYTRPSTAKVI